MSLSCSKASCTLHLLPAHSGVIGGPDATACSSVPPCPPPPPLSLHLVVCARLAACASRDRGGWGQPLRRRLYEDRQRKCLKSPTYGLGRGRVVWSAGRQVRKRFSTEAPVLQVPPAPAAPAPRRGRAGPVRTSSGADDGGGSACRLRPPRVSGARARRPERRGRPCLGLWLRPAGQARLLSLRTVGLLPGLSP